MIDIAFWGIGIAFLGAIYALSRWVRPWLGIIGPVIWVGAVVYVAYSGQMTHIRDYLMAAIGFFVTLVVWGGGINARKMKYAEESDRLNNSLK